MNDQGKKKDLTGGLLIVSKGESVIIMTGSMAADKAWHWSSDESSYLIHCQEAERGRGGGRGRGGRGRGKRLDLMWNFETSKPNPSNTPAVHIPTRPHLIIPPKTKSPTEDWAHGAILIQTTTVCTNYTHFASVTIHLLCAQFLVGLFLSSEVESFNVTCVGLKRIILVIMNWPHNPFSCLSFPNLKIMDMCRYA